MFSSFGSSFFGGPPPGAASNTFEDIFRVYPISMMPDHSRKDDANYGGKIFLPPLALSKLTMLHIRYPMLFSLSNTSQGITTHSGVLEFVAEEGRAYIPQWMMQTLKVSPGQLLKISNCDLPLGSFVKIEPQSVDFLEISDPKAVLENVLRKFSTLSVDDIIEINYNDSIFGIKVLEVKPESDLKGICVVETDLTTDFAPPVGYVEPEYTPQKKAPDSNQPIDPSKFNKGSNAGTMAKSIQFAKLVSDGTSSSNMYGGSGQKLSGKSVSPTPNNVTAEAVGDLDPNAPPVPLNLPENQLFFGFPVTLPTPELTDSETAEQTNTSTFNGSGQSLRQSKKRKDKNNNHPSLKNHTRSPEFIEID
ncbi:ubiquitin fusion degradation protein [Scheffersomyces spartinae]|uniref:Ubiquitin fusion degradation protein n=1 Tax=Scheffersomyces spartinae TaxID=45513 RepID=A0A9P8AK42_9ASCO|nr:ubiquitin fusion degradation protein [Scheffersomyces spartinae]KAG7195497.1 ubiquitin fusion degradation protein [Scheffersomyces spartinae]